MNSIYTTIKDITKSAIENVPYLEKRIIFSGRTNEKKVALTFDDGPIPGLTNRVLDILSETKTPATFFVIGENAENNPDVVKAIYQNGHTLGSHTYFHKDFSKIPDREVLEDIQKGIVVLRQILPEANFCFFRSPRGDLRWRLLPALFKDNLRLVFWNVDPKDFELEDSSAILSTLLQHKYKGGDIILLHDRLEATVDMLPEFIGKMKEKEFRFVTIEELWQ